MLPGGVCDRSNFFVFQEPAEAARVLVQEIGDILSNPTSPVINFMVFHFCDIFFSFGIWKEYPASLQ